MTRGKHAVRSRSVADDAVGFWRSRDRLAFPAALSESGLDRGECDGGVGDHEVVLRAQRVLVVGRTAAEEFQ